MHQSACFEADMSGSPDVIDAARKILAARRRRHRSIPADLLGEPAWDILLDLLVSGAEGHDVSLKHACIASGVPTTTAKRCLDDLTARGMLHQRPDTYDRRRKLIVLTPSGEAMARAAVLDTLQFSYGSQDHLDGVASDPGQIGRKAPEIGSAVPVSIASHIRAFG